MSDKEIKVFKTFSPAKGEVEYLATNKLDMTIKDIKIVTVQRWYQAKQLIIPDAIKQYLLKPTISLEFSYFA